MSEWPDAFLMQLLDLLNYPLFLPSDVEWSEDIPEVGRAKLIKTLISCLAATRVGEVGGLMVGMERGSLEGSGRIHSMYGVSASTQLLGSAQLQ